MSDLESVHAGRPDRARPRLIAAAYRFNGPTETFIRQHVEQLRPAACVSLPWLRTRKWVQRVGLEPLGDALRVAIVRRTIARHRPDLIVAEYGMLASELAHLLKLRDARKIVACFHGHDASRSNLLMRYRRKYRRLFDRAAAIVVVSSDMRDRLVSLGAPESKIVLIPYSIDLTEFRPPDEQRDPLRLLSVGRFVPKKAPDRTIRAFAVVLQSFPAARLVMLGDGPLLADCRGLAGELGIQGSIEFRGHCSHEEVAREMQLAGMFVQHSVVAPDGDREGTPVAALEAAPRRCRLWRRGMKD